MRKLFPLFSLILIICLAVPSMAFGQSPAKAITYDGFDSDINARVLGNMQLGEEIDLRITFSNKVKENSKRIKISLDKEIKPIKGDLKFNIDPKAEYKDITILIEELGIFSIDIATGNQRYHKGYSIQIEEGFSSFGLKGTTMSLEEAITIKDPKKFAEENSSHIDIKDKIIFKDKVEEDISLDEVILTIGDTKKLTGTETAYETRLYFLFSKISEFTVKFFLII